MNFYYSVMRCHFHIPLQKQPRMTQADGVQLEAPAALPEAPELTAHPVLTLLPRPLHLMWCSHRKDKLFKKNIYLFYLTEQKEKMRRGGEISDRTEKERHPPTALLLLSWKQVGAGVWAQSSCTVTARSAGCARTQPQQQQIFTKKRKITIINNSSNLKPFWFLLRFQD